MIQLKSKEQIELIRISGELVGKTLAEVEKNIRPGVTTKSLDQIAEKYIRDHSGIPAFKNYNGFPATLCISINEEVVHGVPGSREIKEGDLVSVDCGVILNKFFADSAYTFGVGEIREEARKLAIVTKEALFKGIEKCVQGHRVGDIGFAIQEFVEQNGFSVVRELCGHGVGFQLHEKPDVLNYGKVGTGPLLKEGMVIAIEPMVNLKSRFVKFDKDGTIRTKDGGIAAHYEHTVAVGIEKADILSSFEYIDQVI